MTTKLTLVAAFGLAVAACTQGRAAPPQAAAAGGTMDKGAMMGDSHGMMGGDHGRMGRGMMSMMPQMSRMMNDCNDMMESHMQRERPQQGHSQNDG
ncbi:MAG: hypothetical protein ACREFQ_17800 [Stellaceae bacterium]